MGWLANYRSQSPKLLPKYADHLSRYYRAQEEKISPLLADTLFWQTTLKNTQRIYTFPSEEEVAFLQKWSEESIVWMLYQDSIPVFWTDNALLIPQPLLARLYRTEAREAVRLNTGFFVLRSKKIPTAGAPLLLLAAIPIKYQYPVEGPFLREKFVDTAGALSDNLSVGPTGTMAVPGPDGSALFYLSRSEQMLDARLHSLALAFFLAAYIFFLMALNDRANYLARKYHPWLGAGLIVGTVILIRVVADWIGFYSTFSDTSFFQDTSNTFIFKQSLGEFFFSSVILLWLMVFFHREFKLQLQPRLTAPWPVIFTTLAYTLSITSLLIIIRLFQSLIMESDLVFDFEYIFGLDFRTILALISGLIIILAFFLFNHRLFQTTSRLGARLPVRLVAAIAALLICWPILYAIDLEISPLFVLMIAIIYVLGLDYTVDRASLSLTAAVCWLLFFAIYTSIIIDNFRQKQDLSTKIAYAQALSDPQDLMLEAAIGRLLPKINLDSLQLAKAAPADSLSLVSNGMLSALQHLFSSEPYLFQHYEFEFFGIDRGNGQPLLANQLLGEGMRLLENRISSIPSRIDQLFYWPQPIPQNFTYLLDLAPADTSAYWMMGIRHRSQKDQRVYGNLIRSIPYKELRLLPLYDYAIYGGPRQLKQSGKIAGSLRTSLSTLEPGNFRLFNDPNRSTLLYRSEQQYTALISRTKGGLAEALSLFSFLFSLLILLVIFLSLLNYYWQALPYTFEFSSLNRASLRNRIQRAVLLLIVGSFVLVGFVTTAFFRRNALLTGSEQLNDKAQAVLADLQRNISNQEQTANGIQLLAPLIEPIADIHNMDINIYDLQGHLQLTSAGFLFRREVTAPLMNPIALQALRIPTQSSYRSDEHIGDLVYQSAYVPIRDGNEEIIAYLELPYYANDREFRNYLQSFLSTLLNVYVFLLLVAGAIALFVAESITQPISKIGQKLSQFRLGHNEPLEWKTPDEIGQLIAEYNLMINKLEESAEKLRQSEREGAWREMAKQVAHEIKNPLTPMKLNIQHLLRVQEHDPERANSMLSEVAQSIIQQIDGLSRIAGEFSNFAKMPQAQNEHFVLNKLVASVYNLYAKGDHGKTELRLDLPEASLKVFADPTQLMRVINNLVKNALQAIPDGRNGQVAIDLKKEGEKAMLSVTDNGSGIPESLKEKVFFPNFTTKNSGMGLGLAMSRSIVNTAGGRIFFTTEENQGTTFYVELPISENNAE